MLCKICNHQSEFIFKKKLLQQYNVKFWKCLNCGFIQTEDPFWLEEAYQLPFNPLDVYLVHRPLELGEITEHLILNYFDRNKQYLDYGGGIGFFTRLMRDKDLNFYRQDKYAQNLYAQFFDISDIFLDKKNFELVTCFEVLEHLDQPMNELTQIFSLSENVFFSTELQPNISVEEFENWPYIGELHGQHISFYTRKSMEIIAKVFKRNYYSNGQNLHLFTTKEIKNFTLNPVSLRIKNKLIRSINKVYNKAFHEQKAHINSLRIRDSEYVTLKINQSSQKEDYNS
jgi:2-polyprenyl-3-methyl-5-hydroxy-6-metoxy-1,4-benzoquinol methylase